MYIQAWQLIRTLPKIYSSFARENPNANAFALSVISTVVASSITASLIDDKVSNMIRKREEEIRVLEKKSEQDIARIKVLESVIDEKTAYLNKLEIDLLDKSLKLKACKSDFKNAGIFRKVETFPESYNPTP